MTIDDELLLELIKPNVHGEVGEKALVTKIVGTRRLQYKLEEPMSYLKYDDDRRPRRELVKIPQISLSHFQKRTIGKLPSN